MSVKQSSSNNKASGDPKQDKSVGSKIRHFFLQNFTKKETIRRSQAKQQGDNKKVKNLFGKKAPDPKGKPSTTQEKKPSKFEGQGDGKNAKSSPCLSSVSTYSTSISNPVSSASSPRSASSHSAGFSEGSASSPISVSTQTNGRSTGSATSPMSTVDTEQSVGSATSPSSPSPSEVKHTRLGNTAVATMKLLAGKSKDGTAAAKKGDAKTKLAGEKSKQDSDKSKQTGEKNKESDAKNKYRLPKRIKKKTKSEKQSSQKSEPAQTVPFSNPDDNRPLDNIYWVTYFQNRFSKQNEDMPRARRGFGKPDTPRPLTRRGPRGILPGMSDIEPYKDLPLRKRTDAVSDLDTGINKAIEKLADKLLAQGSVTDDKTKKDADYPDDSFVEKVIRTRKKHRLPSISKEGNDTLNSLDEYISNIENLIEIQALRKLLAGVMPRGFRGDVMCPKCRLTNRKDPAKEFFLGNRLRNVLCTKHSSLDKSKNYHDDVTDDVDRILHELEDSWWYH